MISDFNINSHHEEKKNNENKGMVPMNRTVSSNN